MPMLSEDDLNLRELTGDELARAWDLWFDLAQTTNEWDPPYTHGVFVGIERSEEDNPPSAGNETSGSRFQRRV